MFYLVTKLYSKQYFLKKFKGRKLYISQSMFDNACLGIYFLKCFNIIHFVGKGLSSRRKHCNFFLKFYLGKFVCLCFLFLDVTFVKVCQSPQHHSKFNYRNLLKIVSFTHTDILQRCLKCLKTSLFTVSLKRPK